MSIDLSKLKEPFPADDVEWRVSRADVGKSGIYCTVLAYLTARAIQQRLDDVCGPENWRVEEPRVLAVDGKSAFAVGISIRIELTGAIAGHEWLTKWDVAEPTNIEAAKGGFSGGMKRAGAQWGIGRYLYHMPEVFAEVAEENPKTRGWNYARLPEKKGGTPFYWKEPLLPGWALPKEKEAEVSKEQLNKLKKAWKDKFAPDDRNPKSLVEGFARFVESVCGVFPIADHTTWTADALQRCYGRIKETTDPEGISPTVPFE
jgi:hypothetical protein